MTDQPPSVEEQIKRYRELASRDIDGAQWTPLLGRIQDALAESADLVERLVKESKCWQELSARCGDDNVVLSDLRNKAEANFRAMTARAESLQNDIERGLRPTLLATIEARDAAIARAEAAEAALKAKDWGKLPTLADYGDADD